MSRPLRNIIETVAEYTGTWEGFEAIYRYAVHWVFDYDTLAIFPYDKLPANDEASRYGKITIPQGLWQKMEGQALAFLANEQTRKSLAKEIRWTPHDHHPRVTATFTGRSWSGFMLIYERIPDGSVRLIESRITIPAVHERARRGHSRIPRLLCELTHDMALRYFEGIPPESVRQREFDLTAICPTPS